MNEEPTPASVSWMTVASVTAFAVVADWLSKLLAAATLADGPVEIGRGLYLRLGHNDGIAFGLGDQFPVAVIVAVTAAVTAVLLVAVSRGVFGPPAASGLVLGGAVGNLGDRVLGGSVVDFIDLTWWPSFNLADVFLTVGVLWSVASTLRDAPTAPPTPPVHGPESNSACPP